MKKYVFVLFFAFCGVTAAQAQVAVIANKSVETSSVDAQTLKRIYGLEESKWGSGGAVVVFDLKTDTPAKDAFYKALGSSASDMKKVWMKAQLSGEGKPPAQVASEAEMIQKVAGTPGAVGYVPADKVTPDVKVIATL